MLPLHLGRVGAPLRVLAVGAHPDDVEIGAGGTLLRLCRERPDVQVRVAVLTSTPERERETRAALGALCAPVVPHVRVDALRDTRLPGSYDAVKDVLAELAAEPADVVLVPSPADAHQDHRLIGELAAGAFRDHLVLHYEIPKWDGDLGAGAPSTYVPLEAEHVERKWRVLWEHHVSQRRADWFTEETFRALARLRGMECRSPYAEAFAVRKAVLAL